MKTARIRAKRVFVALLGNERTQSFSVALFTIFLSLLVGAILLLSLGNNPLLAYKSILQGAGFLPKIRYAGYRNIFTDFMNLLNYLTPMVFASLAVAIAFKSGLFNICVSGMMVFSGFVATLLVGYSTLPPLIARPLVLLVGVGCGALLGALIGYLKYRFNTNEVVSSIMLNYIISYTVSFFIQTRFVDPVTRQSVKINESSRLILSDALVGNLKMNISLVLPLAILLIILLQFLLSRSRLGFELKAVGLNARASRYAGIQIGRTVITAMVLSGSLAGLAGVSYYLGTFASIQPKVLPPLGFDAIAVALLGNSSPVGCLFASLLVTTITNGTTYMSSTLGVLREIASVITGILLLFSACSEFVRVLVRKYRLELEQINEEVLAHV